MITVIGAGILGASCAYHLAKKGEDVTIIDREEPGELHTRQRESSALG